MSKILALIIAVLFIAVSIIPVSSLNVEKIDMKSNESTAKSVEEPSSPWSYKDVHNPNLGYDMERDYDDFDRDLYGKHSYYYRHHLGNHSEYLDKPFSRYPDYEELGDAYRHRYENEYVRNHTLKDRKPIPKPNFAAGKTWYVDDNGGKDFTRIQDAINASSDGDTVFVYGGCYQENVVVDKSIHLEGEDRDTTIIDGSGSGDVVYVSVDWVNINGFSIQNGGNYDSGVLIYSNHNTITGNNITSNNQSGIEIWLSSNNTITGNNITSNNWGGIHLWDSSNNKISGNNINNNGYGIVLGDLSNNNTIYGNNITSNNQSGIEIWLSSNNTITGNNITSNNWGGIHLCFPSDSNTITGNNININWDGIYLDCSSNNKISGNNITNNKWYGIYLIYLSNNNTIYGNNITNNKQGVKLLFSSSNQIIDNLCVANTVDGIGLDYSSGNLISNCTIQNHIMNGIYLEFSPMNLIIGCCIQQNWRGIKIDSNSTLNIIKNCRINDNYWGIKLENSMFNRIEKCTISDNYCGIMRGKFNFVHNNNFIDNKIYDALGELKNKNFWVRNYWSGPNTLLPCYLYGLNVDWFPRATPYDYNYTESYDVSDDYPDNTLWNWKDSTLLERHEKLEKHQDFIDWSEYDLSHRLDAGDYLMNLWRRYVE